MVRQKIKQILVILLMIGCIFYVSPNSFASSGSNRLDKFVSSESNFNFNDYDNPKTNGNADGVAKNAMGFAIKMIRIIATGVAIVMLTYIAIKYMMAAPAEKADFKKSASIFVLGAILIFAAGNILTMIAKFASNNIITVS